MRSRLLIAGVALVAAIALAGGGAYIYFFSGLRSSPTTLGLSSPSASASTSAGTGLFGTWTVTTGSQAGYRVNEILFGQHNEAVGRTTAVTGDATISGTKVNAANVTVDLTKVSSDKAKRDDQFQHRIMDTSTFPTATFKLTQPVDLPSTTGKVSTKATSSTSSLAAACSRVIPGAFADAGDSPLARSIGAPSHIDGSPARRVAPEAAVQRQLGCDVPSILAIEKGLRLAPGTGDYRNIAPHRGGHVQQESRKVVGEVYNRVARKLFQLPIRDVDCDFRLIRRRVLQSIGDLPSSGAACVQLVRMLDSGGVVFAEVARAIDIMRGSGIDRIGLITAKLEAGQ